MVKNTTIDAEVVKVITSSDVTDENEYSTILSNFSVETIPSESRKCFRRTVLYSISLGKQTRRFVEFCHPSVWYDDRILNLLNHVVQWSLSN